MAETKDIETIAYVVHGPKQDFTLEDVILTGMQDSELLVDMKYSGICHTDLLYQQGIIKICPYPAIFGHEGAGTIKAIGPKVKNKDLKVGDFVLLSMNYCEECQYCTTGHPARCVHGTRLHGAGVRPDGSTGAKLKQSGESVRAHFYGHSSLSKMSYVQEMCAVKFDGKPEDAAIFASMGCGYQTGAGTVMNNLIPKPESSIAIFGLGAVGLAALMAAKYMGVKQIIAVDIQPSKLSLAKELGATDLINGREVTDVPEKIKELTGGDGAKFAVECTGVPAVVEQTLNCLGMSGVAAQVGAPPKGVKISLDPSQVIRGSQKFVGVRMGDSIPHEFIPKLVDLQRKGEFPVEKIVTVYDYKDLDKALRDMHDGTTTKPVIQWS